MTKLFIRLVPFLWFRLGLIHLWRLVPRSIRRRASRVLLSGAGSPRERLGTPCSPLLVCGLLRSTTGFGWVARSTLRLAAEAGVQAIPLDLTEILARDNLAAGDPVPSVSGAVLRGPGTLILHFNPNQFPYVRSFLPDEAFDGKYVVASCAWELERIPEEWVRWLDLADEVWAPSRFVAQAIANAGVRLPHRIVPPLLNVPLGAAADRGRFGCSDRDFVVLTAFSFGSGLPRKNPDAAVAAFRHAFSGGSARLILKVSDTGARPHAWARFRDAHRGDPQITIVSEHLHDEEMWSLIASCDVVLSLHRAEGFGMVPAQGMVLGKAVVATGWSGNLDFMNSDNAMLVPYTLVPVDDPEGVFTETGLCWAEPQIEAAATALRRLHDDRAMREALGAAARSHMERYLSDHRRSLVEYLKRIGQTSPRPTPSAAVRTLAREPPALDTALDAREDGPPNARAHARTQRRRWMNGIAARQGGAASAAWTRQEGEGVVPQGGRNAATAERAPMARAELAGLELTVVVPTRNERGNIQPLLERLEQALHGVNWEVVFVDDDSPDGTAEVVRSIARTNPRVRCLQRIGRRGLSSACIEGVLSSAAPYVAVIDADLQHDEQLLPRMLETIKADDLDVVVGSRHVEGGSLGDWASSRQKISSFATGLARVVLRSDLSDPMSGFFMMRRAAFDHTVRRLSGRGFKILLDLFASAPEPFKYKELPYRFGERHSGESKLDTVVALEYVNLLLDKTVGRYVPVSFLLFALVGAFGVLIHMAVLGVAFAVMPFTYAKALATIVAMTSNFVLNNVVTYRDVRLKGSALVRGLFSFYAICSIGAVADVGIASLLFDQQGTSWWLSGLAGIVVGSVWNYAMASVFTWRGGSR